jgi:AP-3 complex subunit delta-1
MLLRSTGDSLAELCVTKLATFLQDPDQNRKHIAAWDFPDLKSCALK